MSFSPTGGEERIPSGRGRRRPCIALSGGEADTETASAATTTTTMTGICTDIVILSIPVGRRTTRANRNLRQLQWGWLEVNMEVATAVG